MSKRSHFSLYLLIFTVGAASLGAEIATARLIAPYFGASTVVWANTIAIVLLALAVGYWLGGRYADRHPKKSGLSLICMAAAALLAAIPFVALPFLDISVKALDTLSAGAFIGSLLAVLALVALPVLLLGAASPYVIRLAAERVEQSGTVAGRVYAISTVGSLVGTFGSALLLIPLVGTRRTFLIFSLALALVSLPALKRRFLLVPALIAVAIALPVGFVKASSKGRVIYEAETTYQYLRVVQSDEGRSLELNEGNAVHSYYRFGSYLTGDVWDGYLTLLFAAIAPPPRRIAILGNAAGTTARAYGEFFPTTYVDAVEIDAKLTAVGRKLFALRNPRMRVFHEDARPYLRRSKSKYDLIAVDAYRQPYIPFYLTTREFFELVKERLAKGGAVIVNAGHPEGNFELERVLAATMSTSFGRVLRYPIEASNTLLLGTNGRAGKGVLLRHSRHLPAGLRGPALDAAAKLGPPLAGGEVYSDDRAPVEWLIDRSIIEYAARER